MFGCTLPPWGRLGTCHSVGRQVTNLPHDPCCKIPPAPGLGQEVSPARLRYGLEKHRAPAWPQPGGAKILAIEAGAFTMTTVLYSPCACRSNDYARSTFV